MDIIDFQLEDCINYTLWPTNSKFFLKGWVFLDVCLQNTLTDIFICDRTLFFIDLILHMNKACYETVSRP